MTSDKRKNVIHELTGHLLAVFDEHEIADNNCILGAAILIEALKRFGIDGVPLPVKVQIANPFITALVLNHVEKHKTYPPPEISNEWIMSKNGWAIGIGRGSEANACIRHKPDAGGWNGHLVVLSGNLLVDATLSQANRPAKQIDLGPVVLEVEETTLESLPDDPNVELAHIKVNGCMVSYRADAANSSYRESADWWDHSRSEFYADRLVAMIRGSGRARIGRNDPCRCGSGRKYKQCCLRKCNPYASSRDRRFGALP